MPIPAFDADGLLPGAMPFAEADGKDILSGHACTFAEMTARFVDAYPHSLTRPALLREMERLVATAHNVLPCLLLVVSGEFVTDVVDPHNLYIVLDVPGQDIDALDPNSQWMLDVFFNQATREFGEDDALTVETGIVRAYPPGHARFDLGNAERMTLRFMASIPVEDSEESGYLEILLCEGGLHLIDEIFAPPRT